MLQHVHVAKHCVPTGRVLLQNLCSSCTAEGDQGSGQQASICPAAASSDALPEQDLRMLSLPFDSACRTIEDCLDLYMSGSQNVGCDCPVCKRPTVIRRTFLELPNTVLMQMQVLDSHQNRKTCEVCHFFL